MGKILRTANKDGRPPNDPIEENFLCNLVLILSDEPLLKTEERFNWNTGELIIVKNKRIAVEHVIKEVNRTNNRNDITLNKKKYYAWLKRNNLTTQEEKNTYLLNFFK